MKDPFKTFTVNLVERAAQGLIDPLIGRDAEVERMIQVLCRRRKNNPVLVGEPGVGKTAIVEGLALRIHQKKVPTILEKAAIYSLDMGALLAGTKFRGEFEQRLKGVIAGVKKTPHAILFIDEIHTIVGAGATTGSSMDASNLLKPGARLRRAPLHRLDHLPGLQGRPSSATTRSPAASRRSRSTSRPSRTRSRSSAA